MSSNFLRIAGLAIALFAEGAFAEAPASLVLSSNLKGYLEPCGCSAAMQGGVSRIAGLLAAVRAEGRKTIYLDVGPALYPDGAVSAAMAPQASARAHTMAAALGAMGVAARVPGRGDERSKIRGAAVVPMAGYALVPLRPGGSLAVIRASSLAEATRASTRARKAGAVFTLAVLPQTWAQARALPEPATPPADLVVLAGDDDGSNRFTLTPFPMVAVESQGRSVLRVDFPAGDEPLVLGAENPERATRLQNLDERVERLRADVNAPGTSQELRTAYRAKLEEFIARREALAKENAAEVTGVRVRFVPVEDTLTKAPEVERLITDYHRQVGTMNLAWARLHGTDCPKAAPGTASFVGSARCATCHQPAYTAWSATKHALAYKTLVTAEKRYHLDCISCHVDGWQRPGGVCRIDRTAGREGVGCESCHGAGSLHVAQPSKTNVVARPQADTCLRCHDKTNSPHFSYDKYVDVIRVQGHGLPIEAPPGNTPAKK